MLAVFFLPLSIVLHEYAHIIVAELFSCPVKEIFLFSNRESYTLSFKISDVEINIGLNLIAGGMVLIDTTDSTRLQKICIYAAGPLSNLIAFILISQFPFFEVAAVCELCGVIINLTPFIPNSDGNGIYKLLRQER